MRSSPMQSVGRRRHLHAAARLAVALPFLAACAGAPSGDRPRPAHPAAELRVVEAQVAAFNDHDAAVLANGVSEDFTWVSVQGDSTSVVVRGRDALRDSMEEYFASVPTVESTLESVVVTPPYVAFLERARWVDGQGRTRSQTSLGVYHVEDGLIRRVWYFPATN